MKSQLLFIHCLSPLHAGVGQGIDTVDLAIAREVVTGFPYLPGSSIKGALRDRARSQFPQEVNTWFGPEKGTDTDASGCFSFGDGNLLLLPVRSIAGTFAYVTCPYILQRFQRDCEAVGLSKLPLPQPQRVEQALVAQGSKLLINQRIYFEDLDFTPPPNSPETNDLAQELAPLLFTDLAEKQSFQQRLCVVHDDVFRFFAQQGTEIVTRVSLDPDTKTAADGQLWTEENLPSESILVSLLAYLPLRKQTAPELKHVKSLLQGEVTFGGKATVGRGRCAVHLAGGPV